MSDTFETAVEDKPPVEITGGMRMLSASEAAAMVENADCETGRQHLLQIVNGRIQAVARLKIRSLERPFGEHAEHGFGALVRPASEATMRGVLDDLQKAGYQVEFGDEPEDSVVRW